MKQQEKTWWLIVWSFKGALGLLGERNSNWELNIFDINEVIIQTENYLFFP